ncbi:MAG: hypothetical protein HUU55_05410 [Myxococcales bacterium]|nr:hypothetical protein [Myxococcales bacterium]
MRDRVTITVGTLVAIIVLAGAFWVYTMVFDAQTPANEPVEPVWGKEVCAFCQMHVTEHGFAVQAHLPHGETVFFDDPGCYFQWESSTPAINAVWFHHLSENRWLKPTEVGFSKVAESPMGFGLAAVHLAEPGVLSFAAAQALLGKKSETKRTP